MGTAATFVVDTASVVQHQPQPGSPSAGCLVHDIIEASQRTKTPQGFLLVPAVFSRAGIHDYRAGQIGLTDRDPNSVVKVYRPPEEVFDAASMATFGRVPVTNDHPGGSGQVTLDNIDSLSVGMSDEVVTQDGDLMRGQLLITGKRAISDIEAGKSNLSNGYHAMFDLSPGTTPQGEAYDAVQRNIKGNHIAIVDSGRGGPRVAIADKGDGIVKVKITLDGKEYEVDQAVADAMTEAEEAKKKKAAKDQEEEEAKKKKEAEDAELEKKGEKENPELKVARKAKDEADRKVEQTQAALDAALERIPTSDQLDARVDERSAVLDTARRLVTDIETTGKSNEAIRREVVEAKCKGVTDRSDDYIEARFDQLAEGGGEAARFAERNFSGPGVQDADLGEGAKAKAAYLRDLEDAHLPEDQRRKAS